jgi:hypothetical protein
MFDAGFSLTCPLRIEETLERLGRIIHPDPGVAGRLAHTLTVTVPQPLWFWGSVTRGGFRCFRAHVPGWGSSRHAWPHPGVEGQLLDVERGTQMFVTVRPRGVHWATLALLSLAALSLALLSVGFTVVVAPYVAYCLFMLRERVTFEARFVREELQRLLLLA